MQGEAVMCGDEVVASLQPGSVQVPIPRTVEAPRASARPLPRVAPVAKPLGNHAAQGQLVPVARDGSWFSPDLRRPRGGYTIGAKGEEVVVDSYSEALHMLRLMDVPRWRRPNAQGNWGIVAAVQWKPADQLVG